MDNDATLENLGRAARSYGRAGCDIVAPSGMMDGMIQAIRQGLDDACAGPICDPGCVEQMIKAGVGAEVIEAPAIRTRALPDAQLPYMAGHDLIAVTSVGGPASQSAR